MKYIRTAAAVDTYHVISGSAFSCKHMVAETMRAKNESFNMILKWCVVWIRKNNKKATWRGSVVWFSDATFSFRTDNSGHFSFRTYLPHYPFPFRSYNKINKDVRERFRIRIRVKMQNQRFSSFLGAWIRLLCWLAKRVMPVRSQKSVWKIQLENSFQRVLVPPVNNPWKFNPGTALFHYCCWPYITCYYFCDPWFLGRVGEPVCHTGVPIFSLKSSTYAALQRSLNT